MKPPSVDRRVLVLTAGIVWSAVGLVLILAAIFWLASSHENVIIPAAVGVIGGAIVYRFGFVKLARRNLIRVYQQAPGKDRVCMFAFQNARSYVIAACMMLMGYGLRHLPISKVYLAPIYSAIGLALLLSSLQYYHHLSR
jgi:uncharacterized membrane protein